MTDAEAANINRLLVAISDATGIPLETTVTWKQYPASYGSGNGVRLSRSAFANYRGVLGHQHVCDNDHGDPGNLPIAKILGAHRDTQQPPSRGIQRPPVVQPAPASKGLNVKTIDLRNASSTNLVKGDGVKPLQRLLGIGADGLAGGGTRAALGAAQKRCGETVDYIFGPATAEALLSGK